MPKFVTPARLTAALGVLTGLSAAVTSFAGALPLDSSISKAVVGVGGVLGACATLVKFLEGQASWEASPAGQAQAVITAVQQTSSSDLPENIGTGTTGIDETYAPASALSPSAS